MYKIGSPYVLVSSLGLVSFWANMFRSPTPRSYVPGVLTSFTDKTTFLERVLNVVVTSGVDLFMDFHGFGADAVIRKQLGDDMPSWQEVEKNASLFLLNTDLSFDYSKPMMPNIINVGGMHCREPRKLDKVSFVEEFENLFFPQRS